MNAALANMTGKIKRTKDTIECMECGKSFPHNRKADLQRHMRVHTNEKPYVCPYEGCGKAFKQSAALKNHRNTHTGERPVRCDICNMSFYDKPTCNRHRKEKHGLDHIFKCPSTQCASKDFKRKAVFKKHLSLVHSWEFSDTDIAKYRVRATAENCKALAVNGSSRSLRGSDADRVLPGIRDTLAEIPGVRHSLMTGAATMHHSGPYHTGTPTFTTPASVTLKNPYALNPTDNALEQAGSSTRGFARYSNDQIFALQQTTHDPSSMPIPTTPYERSTTAFLGAGYSPDSSSRSLSVSPGSYMSSSSASSFSSGSYSISPRSSPLSRSPSVSPSGAMGDYLGV